MKIAVLADTHISNRASDLPAQVYRKLEDVDLILHAGDIMEEFFLRRLEKIKTVIAVRGNMDSERLKMLLPESKVISKGGFKIGLTHGSGHPKKTLENVKSLFSSQELDVIIFGHTHVVFNETIDDTIYFNPGSPTDKVFSAYNSFGIITIDDTIKVEIIKIER